MRRPDLGLPRLVLVVLVVCTVAGIVLAASTSSVAFGSFNSAWDGASELQTEAESAGAEGDIIRNVSGYSGGSQNDTLAVILSPTDGYGPGETDRIRTFVRNGGTLLVAEDFGEHSNDLLARIGAQARIDGRVVRDERYNYRAPSLPVAQNVSNHTLTRNVDSFTLNRGTYIRPNGAKVLAGTSQYAYVDSNRNGNLDDSDPVRTVPVVTTESVGDGQVVVVSDPSAFINAMLDRPGNQAFVSNLFGAHERVLLDYSHAQQLPPLTVALLIIRETPIAQLLLGVMSVFAVALWTRDLDILQRVRGRISDDDVGRRAADPESLASFVRKRHPDWEDERVERVIRGIMSRRDEEFKR